ncbi:MAG: histidyl-tRNA synthetase, histidyl-tRNA synthetase [Candidatus Parcubacteria bacterium]|jgi:histidyl-tRNA synthetase
MVPEKTTKQMRAPKEKSIQSVKGMRDVAPNQQALWDKIRSAVASRAVMYNFSRIDTPILEHANLFERTLGEDTDVIEKEMYVIRTKGGDVLAMRPEGTAGVMRAFLENGLSRLGTPQKLYYEGPMFRHENPQAGRLRQFTQAGFEIVSGANDGLYDAQVIVVAQSILEELKIKNTVLKINSIGCRVCRPIYKKQLVAYYKNSEKDLCEDCKRRIKTNPLRLLDCKKTECQKLKTNAPNILDKLCVTCSQHFKEVLEYLDELGIAYTLTNHLVRGLDYYSRTVFEIHMAESSKHDLNIGAIGSGGRYDYLAEMIGGRQTPAVGFALGYERIIEVLQHQQTVAPEKPQKKVFVAHAGELAKKKALSIIQQLHKAQIQTSENLAKESLAAQLKAANKEGMHIAIIVGQKEIYEQSVIVRDLVMGLQETFPLNRMVEEIKKRLKS